MASPWLSMLRSGQLRKRLACELAPLPFARQTVGFVTSSLPCSQRLAVRAKAEAMGTPARIGGDARPGATAGGPGPRGRTARRANGS
jgi:hypothetical protein